MPHVKFVMIGAPMTGFEALHQQVKRASQELPNLEYLGPVPYAEVNAYFARSKLFLNTSDSEGFPNSYLQAWIRGVPVISYFDPDGLIASQRIGAAVASQEDFRGPIAHLLESAQERTEMGGRARQFAHENYSPTAIVERYRQLIDGDAGLQGVRG